MLTAKDQSKDDPYSVLYSAALKNVLWKTYQSKDDLQSTKYQLKCSRAPFRETAPTGKSNKKLRLFWPSPVSVTDIYNCRKNLFLCSSHSDPIDISWEILMDVARFWTGTPKKDRKYSVEFSFRRKLTWKIKKDFVKVSRNFHQRRLENL